MPNDNIDWLMVCACIVVPLVIFVTIVLGVIAHNSIVPMDPNIWKAT